jgi:flagellar P-ring protein FlgI
MNFYKMVVAALALLPSVGICQNAAKTTKKPQTRTAKANQNALPESAFQPGLTRIKDIADVQGVRGNQLVGYGLVVGLEGTGDGQAAFFTVQSVANMLRKQGVTIDVPLQQLQVKNVAAVMVTANLPAFAKNGNQIDVTVSSMGDAKSLQGGLLLRTPLLAADGQIYAVAQGSLTIGGFNFSGNGSSVQKNFTNIGRIPKGALVEQEVPTTLTDGKMIQITTREADFTTVSRIAEAISKAGYTAQATDGSTVSVMLPQDFQGNVIGFIARIETLTMTPDSQARIVINERTGTVVMGGNVRLAPGAVAHGSISVRIDNNPVVIPPAPFNPNPGVVVPLQDTKVTEKKAQLATVPATTTLDQLVRALNALGVTPRDLIAILQAMKAANMVNAQLEVQ